MTRLRTALPIMLVAALALTACSKSADTGAAPEPGDKILRIAMPEPGKDAQKVWDQIKTTYEKENAGWTLQFIQQNDDLYSTVGLANLLSGKNAPDAYFEWTGNRLDTRFADGFAADIGAQLQAAGITDRYNEGAFGGTEVDGKTAMLPISKDVSNVIWYSKKIFAEQSITPPTTWEELDAACAKLKGAGILPYAMGNKDLWPAGNWVGHLLSRGVGEQAYADALQLKSPLNSPDMVSAMGLVQQIHDNGWINESVNSVSDNEGYTLFLTGKSAMTPIGSWMVDIRNEQAADFEMDWFNLPAVPSGKGDQASVLGVGTGYIANAKSTKIDQVINMFKVMTSDPIAKAFVEAGNSSLLKSTATSSVNPLSAALLNLIDTAPTIVAPPDTGYSLKVADALNSATSAVLGGALSPQEALDQAQQKVDALT